MNQDGGLLALGDFGTLWCVILIKQAQINAKPLNLTLDNTFNA